MIFTRKNKIVLPNNKLRLGDNDIKIVDETNYLGVTFHKKLNWSPHIKNKILNAKKKLFKYKGPIKSNWGPP